MLSAYAYPAAYLVDAVAAEKDLYALLSKTRDNPPQRLLEPAF
ncbi:hypothetical protein T03_1466 [Trichinella britovi]|uniref:Uncharacterized protein n=1 Tax=Trichinella britovi TaxID=45882 RepID=A0A0V1B853_TRIBR|nr:hypothetical protein T03_1466 [Trichinella britovi]